MASWKRLSVISAGFGAGFAICAALLIVAEGYWYPSTPRPPKPWNTNALKIGAAKAIPFDTNQDGIRTGILFAFEAENMTERDLTLPQDIAVMQETKSSHALHDSFLKTDRDYFIPAHHAVWVVLANSGLCGLHSDPPGCFHKYFEDDQEIVLFDRQGRHEIHIPMPALTTAKIDGTLEQAVISWAENQKVNPQPKLPSDYIESLRKRNACEQRFYDKKIFSVHGRSVMEACKEYIDRQPQSRRRGMENLTR